MRRWSDETIMMPRSTTSGIWTRKTVVGTRNLPTETLEPGVN